MATAAQIANAQIIVSTGVQLGANDRQLLAAIEAALVESDLRNLNYGDRDSLGLFQQRPSQGWGSPSQVQDPFYAARAFFVGAGTNNGALQVSQAGTAGQLAQRVQRSAFPGRYDQREAEARSILVRLGSQANGSQADDEFFGIPSWLGDLSDSAETTSADSFSDESMGELGSRGVAVGSLGWLTVGVFGLFVLSRLFQR